jgi:hypothetical protein
MFRQHLLGSALIVVLVIAAACSSNNPAPQVVPPTATTGPQSAPPTNTLPPAAPTNTPAPPAPTEVAPAVEPLQPTATAAPTATLIQTIKPRATARPRNTAAPLNVTYEVTEIKRKPGDEATLVLKVYATGGSGGYRYYHDDIQQPQATFNIPGRCGKPFVHTIKVTTGDGQTVAVPYHVNGVCPTPTP